jgi:hypothetical protein
LVGELGLLNVPIIFNRVHFVQATPLTDAQLSKLLSVHTPFHLQWLRVRTPLFFLTNIT